MLILYPPLVKRNLVIKIIGNRRSQNSLINIYIYVCKCFNYYFGVCCIYVVNVDLYIDICESIVIII